jgi:putative DNA-invertase from lambdoid prophage Rac
MRGFRPSSRLTVEKALELSDGSSKAIHRCWGSRWTRYSSSGAYRGSRRLQERPEGKRLLEVVQPGDTVLTTKLDRMFRSALDALEVLGQLKRQSVSLHMIDLGGDVTTDGIAKLVFTILSAVAEAERDRTRERIADVKRDQRARGRYLGGSVPFGWRKGRDGALVAEPSEQGAIRRMVRLRQKGQSLRDISGAMKNEGFDLSSVSRRSSPAAVRTRPTSSTKVRDARN